MFWRTVLAMIVVTALAERESFASCSCMASGPPCQAAWASDVVFLGTVLSIDLGGREIAQSPFGSTLVKFRVDRPFIDAPSGHAEIEMSAGSITCAYQFALGGTYLVYARKTASSRLSTSVCSRTRPVADADEDIRYLTTIGSAPIAGRVYGRVNEYGRDPAEEEAVDYGPVAGLTLSVRGDQFARDTVTDANGKFEIMGVPVGKATLTAVAPFGFEPEIFEEEIEIKDPRACSEVDFSIEQVARASGVVVDGSGQPVGGIEVDAVAAELAGFDPPPYQDPVTTDEHGIFEFPWLPPGAYVFGVNLTKFPRGPRKGIPLFLPGTRLASKATVIELRAGNRTDVGVLRLTDR
jgi:hypothetical protein